MKSKNKKILLSLGTLATIATSTAAVISCGIEADTPKDFTVGYALDPISSLNYIKYKSTLPFAHSLVEGFIKAAPQPESALKNYMSKAPSAWLSNGGPYTNTDLGIYAIKSGVTRTSSSEVHGSGENGFENFQSPDKDGHCLSDDFDSTSMDTFNINLNGESEWANGDKLTSSDFIDFVGYVLDLNTGSQLIQNIKDLGLAGVDEFVNAQTEYAKKFNVLYKNPFGYIDNPEYLTATEADKKFIPAQVQSKVEFPLQLNKGTEERTIVDKIEKAARNIGIFGDDSSSHPYVMNANEQKYYDQYPTKKAFEDAASQDESDWQDASMNDVTPYVVGLDDISPYKIRLKTKMKVDAFTFVVNTLMRSYILPVNRKFVEAQGGVEKFGLDKDSFLTEGPFKIKELILGNAGSAVLSKDESYHEAQYTLPDSVKIFFQSDPVIKSSLFEDGYISQSKLTAITAKRFYSDEMYRGMVSKASGYGTTGLVFNLDPKSEGYNKYLADPDLRRAIFYSIDRGEIIKLSGFDATTPSYAMTDWTSAVSASWMAPQQGVSVGQYGASAVFHSSHKDKIKLFPYSGPDYASTGTLLGNLDKTDKVKNYESAKFYFNKFKAKYPDAGQIKIEFTNDSTKAQINIGTTLQTQIDEALGKGALDIELKSYPKSIYDSFYASGKFEMTYRNMDYLDHGGDQYSGAFMTKDEISKEDQKLTGFTSNPSGAWTFEEVFALPQTEQDEIRTRLEISDVIWKKIEELSKPATAGGTLEEKLTNQKDAIAAFFARTAFTDSDGGIHPVDPNFNVAQKVTDLTIAVNKLIMDQCPVIPLFVVDVRLQITRMAGYSITNGGGLYAFDYAYDLLRKPRPDLPGLEALAG